MQNIIVGRTRSRAQAVQVLFQAEVQGKDVFDLLEGGEFVLEDGPITDFALQLARGVAVNRIAVDRLVGGVSHNWNLSRMPLVDRCIMGIAIFEMFCEDDIPSSVAISEAVELSKVYGSDDSSSFVNGILGRIDTLSAANPGVPLAVLASMVADGTCATEIPEEDVAQTSEDPAAAEPAEESVAEEASEDAVADGAAEDAVPEEAVPQPGQPEEDAPECADECE